jgi:hypothetical protein
MRPFIEQYRQFPMLPLLRIIFFFIDGTYGGSFGITLLNDSVGEFWMVSEPICSAYPMAFMSNDAYFLAKTVNTHKHGNEFQFWI